MVPYFLVGGLAVAVSAAAAPPAASQPAGQTFRITDSEGLKRALFNAEAGDTIMLAPGAYQALNATFAHDGAPGRPITLCGEPGQPRPVISRGSHSQTVFTIDRPGAGHYVFRDLVISQANHGLVLGPPAPPRLHDIRIENCELHDFAGSAIRAVGYGVERVYVRGCTAHDCQGTEGAFDFKINKADPACGGGSRQVVIQDCAFFHQTHKQSSAVIVQNSCENFCLVGNTGYDNGEIAFAFKAGGWNIVANNIGYNQSKSAYYLRSPDKREIQGCPPANYLLINNIGVTRRIMEGDQGALMKWPDTNLWAFQNTFVSVEEPGGGFTGNPVVLASGKKGDVKAVLKNNIVYRAGGGRALTIDGDMKRLKLRLAGNLFFVEGKKADDDIIRISRRELNTIDALVRGTDSPGSRYGDPLFTRFDPGDDRAAHDFSPRPGSAAFEAHQAYCDTDPDDYGPTLATFLKAFNRFEAFACMTPDERAGLLRLLETAHLHDRNGRSRGPRPAAGALAPAPTTMPAP